MKAQRLVESDRKIAGKSPEERPYALDRDGSDPLSLSLRVTLEAGARSVQQHLERMDAVNVEVTGTTVITPRPRRSAVVLAPSLLTMTAGRGVFASAPRDGSRSTSRISPRRIS